MSSKFRIGHRISQLSGKPGKPDVEGSKPCPTCGKTISATKVSCGACQLSKLLRETTEQEPNEKL
jgi:hypothetical protein